MAPQPSVSVVVATHNRSARLAELLRSLRSQSLAPEEVIVVDDGSSDGTAAMLDAERAAGGLPLRVIRRGVAAGPATAREAGWRAASGDLIAFTDDDCVATPGWLAAAAAAWDGDGDRFVQGRTEPAPAERAAFGPFSRTISITELDPAFNTCNMLYPRELLVRIGGFDTETFGREPGGEDCDLGWRAIEAGAHPAFASQALVHHAVNDLGPIGKLRVAARWSRPLRAYARHPELRRVQFTHRIFWKRIHWLLFRAVVGLLLPTRWHALRNWLIHPYARTLWARGRVYGGGPLLIPYYLLHDLVEVLAVARAAVRTRTPML